MKVRNRQKVRNPIIDEEVDPDEKLMRSIEEQTGEIRNRCEPKIGLHREYCTAGKGKPHHLLSREMRLPPVYATPRCRGLGRTVDGEAIHPDLHYAQKHRSRLSLSDRRGGRDT
jgi:hypothetical protein